MTQTKNENSTESSNASISVATPQNLDSDNTDKPVKKNKGGRPPGAKNTLTLLQEAAQEGIMTEVLDRFDGVVNKTIELAENGDPTCLKILWDRVIPAKKASDGKGDAPRGGITIVVQGTNIRQGEVVDAEVLDAEDV